MPGPPTASPLPLPSMALIREALASWFAVHGRRLAFRSTTDPWSVLVSEVMAQQTQVSRVEPAWQAFLASFPTPVALASASRAAALRAWAGMGYNRRALALQRAAVEIVERHDGRVPSSVGELEALPGIGPYTARAVAAIAFGVPVAPVDTNIRRVVGRLVAVEGGEGAARIPERELQQRADALVDARDPGRWTHAMMDLGAGICRPRAPRCDRCPLAAWCPWPGLSVRRATIAPTQATEPSAARRIAPPRAAARAPTPFPMTRRWLRGRIIADLRDLPDGVWLRLPVPMGTHGAEAVSATAADLAREGLVEQRSDGALRLPSTPR